MSHDLLSQKSEIADLMLSLEKCLRELALWQTEVPPMQSLMSVEPFACDTLNLTEWLQWIFIPKMKHIIESESPLPSNSNITAYAEEALKGVNFPTHNVLELIRAIDQKLQ